VAFALAFEFRVFAEDLADRDEIGFTRANDSVRWPWGASTWEAQQRLPRGWRAPHFCSAAQSMAGGT
jgi:hypothetical protein